MKFENCKLQSSDLDFFFCLLLWKLGSQALDVRSSHRSEGKRFRVKEYLNVSQCILATYGRNDRQTVINTLVTIAGSCRNVFLKCNNI